MKDPQWPEFFLGWWAHKVLERSAAQRRWGTILNSILSQDVVNRASDIQWFSGSDFILIEYFFLHEFMQEVNADKYKGIYIVLELQFSFVLSYCERTQTKNHNVTYKHNYFLNYSSMSELFSPLLPSIHLSMNPVIPSGFHFLMLSFEWM